MNSDLKRPAEVRIGIVANSARVAFIKTRLVAEGFSNLALFRGRDALLQYLRQHRAEHAPQAGLGQAASWPPAFDLLILSEVLEQAELDQLIPQVSSGQLGGMGLIMVTDADLNAALELQRRYRDLGALDVLSLNGSWQALGSRLLLAAGLVEERRQRHQAVSRYKAEISQRKVLETRLRYQVMHDEITGVGNYKNLEQRLENSTLHARQYGQSNGLIYINLGQFRLVNDIEGHEAGNQVLIRVASALRAELDSETLLARIGADEFAVLLENCSEDQLQQTARRLHAKINAITYIGRDNHYHATASLGLALQTPASAETAQKFFSNAKYACALARKRGRNCIYRFNPDDDGIRMLEQDLKWVQRIRDALAGNQFSLMFQPVLDIKRGQISHSEALLRMRGRDGELVSPAQFIPVAERMGLIQQIDLWVVEHGLDIIGRLHDSYDHISFGLNLSAHAFESGDLLPLVERKLEQHWINPGRIVFEITETAAITSVGATRDLLGRLRAMGCRFALDDFGSGFASFSYLKNFPVDLLKIDGSFIVNLHSDPMDQLLVKSMVEVAHRLNKKVIAEFVETQEVLDMLQGYGVDYAQGYLIGRPTAQMESLLGRRQGGGHVDLLGDDLGDGMLRPLLETGWDSGA
ncbi:MAG: EAL domain-containing protein [Gammaproteobacteria bacterium]|nr:EAL domain-containing protein [Gammaproteobacteria bacterium]